MKISQQYYGELENIYNEIYTNKLDRWSEEPQMRAVQRYLYEYVSSEFFNIDNVNLLDIGCGKGHDSYFFASNGIKVTGIDPCEQETWKLCKSNNPVFIKSSIFDFQSQQKYDVILDNGCSHHFDPNDYNYFLEQVAKLLNKDSIFCINVFCTEKSELVLEDNGRYSISFSYNDLIDILKQHNFKVIHTKYLKRENKYPDYLLGFFKSDNL